MKYADCPTQSIELEIDAPAAVVWDLVSDIGLSARFSTEVSGAEWLDGADGPALGARFVGHNAHDAIGEWATTCVVTRFEPGRTFEWSVTGGDGDVSSIWRFTVTPVAGDRCTLAYWYQMGPGRSGLSSAIDAMPDKEERIVARRLEEHRVNMQRVVDGVRQLAEDRPT